MTILILSYGDLQSPFRSPSLHATVICDCCVILLSKKKDGLSLWNPPSNISSRLRFAGASKGIDHSRTHVQQLHGSYRRNHIWMLPGHQTTSNGLGQYTFTVIDPYQMSFPEHHNMTGATHSLHPHQKRDRAYSIGGS